MRVPFSFLSTALIALALSVNSFAGLYINEVQPSNQKTLVDDKGAYPDWIEIYNSGTAAVNLSGYFLSDNPANLSKWAFPQVSIPAKGFVLVYASNLEPSDGSMHANFKLSADGETVFLVDNKGVISDSVTFGVIPTDVSWARSPDGAATWFLAQKPTPKAANVGAVATTTAQSPTFSKVGGFYTITEATTGVDGHPLDHENAGNNAYAGDNSSVTPAEGASFYVAAGAYTHVAYALASTSEYAGYEMFVNPAVNIVGAQTCILKATIPAGKQFDIGFQQSDLNGRSRYRYIVTGTGVENDSYEIPLSDPTGVLNLAALTSFKLRAVQAGAMNVKIYDIHFHADASDGGPLSITISAAAGDTIRYTLDGSVPTSASKIYQSALSIDSTTLVRARAFGKNKLPSTVISQSYFVNQRYAFPIVSIQMDDADLNGYLTGFYVKGPNAEGAFPYKGANFWQDWEKAVNVEFFEANGQQVVNQAAGASIFGGWTRGNDQKSVALYARQSYGKEGFDYAFFANRPFSRYNSLVLRTGGNDWDQSLIRDVMMTSLVDSASIELQAYRPCIVLFNGKNYGMHFIREKINEDFLASRYGFKAGDVDILEQNGDVVSGDSTHYMDMMSFIESHDLSVDVHYQDVAQRMDVANFAAYFAAEIYFANTDWPGNNIKFWRLPGEGNKWRWILYDTDFGYNLWGGAKNNSASSNTLTWATNTGSVPSDQANSAKYTYLFRSLLGNGSFKNLFINTMMDFLNTYFQEDRAGAHIDDVVNQVEPGMAYHEASSKKGGFNSYTFDANISDLKNFASRRPEYMRGFLQSYFNLNDPISLTLKTVGQGKIKLTAHAFVSGDWTGSYFQDVPVTLTAVPTNGHPFTGWSGSATGTDLQITLPMSQASQLTATFGTDPTYIAPVPEPIVNVAIRPHYAKQKGADLLIAQGQIRYLVEEAQGVQLRIVDLKGRQVFAFRGDASVGWNQMALPHVLGAGRYVVQLRSRAGIKSQWLQVR